MIEHEKEPHTCYNCDEEFIVHTPTETKSEVAFCPFCGSDIEDFDEDLDFGEDEEDTL